MYKRHEVLPTILCVILLLLFSLPAMAAGPYYQQYPETINSLVTTADTDLLSAPGANYYWYVTGLGWSVLTVETAGTATVTDKAGTPVHIHSIPLDSIIGGSQFMPFSEGIMCSANSGVQVDFSGSTGELSIFIIAYKRQY